MPFKSTLQSLIAIALILGVGVPLYLWTARVDPPPSAPPREVGPIPARTRTLEPRDLELVVEAYGTFRPRRVARLASEVSGRIVRVHPDWRPGGVARVGEDLFAVDPGPYELELRAAEATLAEAKASLAGAEAEIGAAEAVIAKARESRGPAARELERLEAAGAGEVVSELALDRARASLLTAELAEENARASLVAARARAEVARARTATATGGVTLARDRLERTVLRAPFDGRFVGTAPGEGSFTTAGAILGELADHSVLRLEARLSEEDVAAVRVGQRARVLVPARPGLALAGEVGAVGVVADPRTRSVGVEIRVANPEEGGGLQAGSFGRTTIEVGERHAAVVVQRSEIEWRGDRAIAFVLERASPGSELGVARRRELALGRPHGEGFVVVGGLEAGEELLLSPLDRLREGSPCRTAPEASEAGDPVATGASPAEAGEGGAR